MKKNILFLLLLLTFVLPAQEGTFHFEKASKSPGRVAENWSQNKAAVFKPYGEVTIQNATFGNYKKCVRISSSKKHTDLLASPAIPAKAGDVFAVTFAFRSPDGKSKARVGIYHEYQAAEIAPISKDWDQRTVTFEIKKPNTKKIQFFLAARPDTTIDYAFLHYKKLDSTHQSAYTPGKMSALWKERTKGRNLAYGKKVRFIPEPVYPLTRKGNTDQNDLTDNRIRPVNALWFESGAVAWYKALHGAMAIIDLGKERNVKKAVIRINGGRKGAITFPQVLECHISKDGKNFYPAHVLKKVAHTEANMADWKDLYYLPESKNEKIPTYVYPFELNVNARARYVAVRAPIYTAILMITDELAVMEADKKDIANPSFNAPYKKSPRPLVHRNVIIGPKLDKFYIASNMKLPNYLTFDARTDKKVKEFSYTIDLPKEITFTPESAWPAFTRTFVKREEKGNRAIFHFTTPASYTFKRLCDLIRSYQLGPFFFTSNGKKIPQKEKYVVFTTRINGVNDYAQKLPLEILTIPVVPPIKKLNISLAWTENRHFMTYPDYLDTQKKLGFNTLPLFPISKDAPRVKKLMEEAVKKGYKIRQQMSPSHYMFVKEKKDFDYKCKGAEKLRSVCPSYRGKFYKEMLTDIRNAVRDYPADYVTFDEEVWGVPILEAATKCARCNTLRLQKKMDWPSYLQWAMGDYLSAYKKAVHEGARLAGKKPPIMSFYALVPPNTPYGNIKTISKGKVIALGYPHLYPKYADEIQDSYYGRSSRMASLRARAIFKVIKDPAKISPWITGGTGAHTETHYPERTGQHLIETLMNGASGIQYFMFPSFESPLDYYSHAKAMKLLQPFEDILMKGGLDERFTGSDKTIHYTCRTLGKRSLILLGNYEAVKAKTTLISVEKGAKVFDLVNKKEIRIQNQKAKATVKADDYLLLLITKK